MEHFDGRKGFQLISMEEGILFTRIDRIPFAKFVWSSVCRYSYEYSQYAKKCDPNACSLEAAEH